MPIPKAISTASTSAVLSKAISALLDELELKSIDLASWLGIDPGTITKLRQGKFVLKPNSNEGQRALLVLRVYRSLSVLLGGDREQIISWLTSMNSDIGSQPLNAMKDIVGLVHVAEYLDAMRGKI